MVNAIPVKYTLLFLALSEVSGVALAVYLIMYTKKKWLWAGLLSITAGLFANIVWIIPPTRK